MKFDKRFLRTKNCWPASRNFVSYAMLKLDNLVYGMLYYMVCLFWFYNSLQLLCNYIAGPKGKQLNIFALYMPYLPTTKLRCSSEAGRQT